jgi:thioredoxin
VSLTLLAPAVAVLVLALAWLLLRGQRMHQIRLLGRVVASVEDQRPTLLYFTGEACTICHTAQRPAVHSLAAEIGEAASVREVDVAKEPELARRYRVMSLPTTIVLRPGGVVAAVNTGFVPAERLRGQLQEAGLQLAA